MSVVQNQWKRVHSTSGGGDVFERPLGQTESGFYWDSVFERTADILRHAEVEIKETSVERILSPANLVQAWTILKERYPLLGATVQDRLQDGVHFIVDSSRLQTSDSQDFLFEEIKSAEEVDQKVDRLLNGHSPLSNSLLACIIILQRANQPNHVHILIHSTHFISDEIAHHTLLREFLQMLSDPLPADPVSLTERLALSLATDSLHPWPGLSSARLRWRWAIGRTITDRRRYGMTGGHTLPRKISSNTMYTPAHSCSTSFAFSQEESRQFLQTCRDNQLTFGSVLSIIGQLAMARVLCNHYLQGKMSQSEWEFRKIEPMVNAGPLNLRPFADPQWRTAGGGTNVSLAIGFYFHQLAAMPLGPAAASRSQGDVIPDHFEMLPKNRFFNNCRMMKRKITEYIRHPLFFDMNVAYLPARLERSKEIGVNWRTKVTGPGRDLSPQEQASNIVINHGGATLGNLDGVLPWEYPQRSAGATPQGPEIKLLRVRSFLHCRPTELYLGASTFRQQLKFHIFWDGNVYDKEVVEEWLTELAEISRKYLN